jgi:hypothetical protein
MKRHSILLGAAPRRHPLCENHTTTKRSPLSPPTRRKRRDVSVKMAVLKVGFHQQQVRRTSTGNCGSSTKQVQVLCATPAKQVQCCMPNHATTKRSPLSPPLGESVSVKKECSKSDFPSTTSFLFNNKVVRPSVRRHHERTERERERQTAKLENGRHRRNTHHRLSFHCVESHREQK